MTKTSDDYINEFLAEFAKAGIVFTEGAHGAVKPITGEFAVPGAIYTATDGTIYMYA